MKFSDIDFSAISRMMDNMSDEEKNKLNDMAQNMMNNMKQNEEPEEETDFYEALNINEEDYAPAGNDLSQSGKAGHRFPSAGSPLFAGGRSLSF